MLAEALGVLEVGDYCPGDDDEGDEYDGRGEEEVEIQPDG